MAQGMRPGMTEQDGNAHAASVLREMGMDRIWHPVIVRFGEGTLKNFKEQSDSTQILAEDDIFFVDIGPVWQGHEGDVGDSFVIGDAAEKHACAQAVRDLWHDVGNEWSIRELSGTSLYEYASNQASAMGWRLNLDVKGHRVCDFPHAIYRAGHLGDFGLCPTTGLWILEIQIAHLTRPFGAFFEDLLASEEIESP